MTILDRLLGHDAWTTRQLLLRCRDLTDEQLDREFDIGHRTLRRTFLHILRNMEGWTDFIAGRDIRPNLVGDTSVATMLARLDSAAAELAAVATSIERAGRLDETRSNPTDPTGAEASLGGAIVHVITHSMHHRAQVHAVRDDVNEDRKSTRLNSSHLG